MIVSELITTLTNLNQSLEVTFADGKSILTVIESTNSQTVILSDEMVEDAEFMQYTDHSIFNMQLDLSLLTVSEIDKLLTDMLKVGMVIYTAADDEEVNLDTLSGTYPILCHEDMYYHTKDTLQGEWNLRSTVINEKELVSLTKFQTTLEKLTSKD